MSEVLQTIGTPFQGITLTESAKIHLLDCLAKERESQGIRFSVKKTGCSGFSYQVDCVPNLDENDYISPFQDNYSICIDKKSYPFLKGMIVDYVKSGLSNKLIFTNPNQKGQCGCGESFTVS